MKEAIIQLVKVVNILLNLSGWVNTEPELYAYIACRTEEVLAELRTRGDLR